jgi:hypothetical protein
MVKVGKRRVGLLPHVQHAAGCTAKPKSHAPTPHISVLSTSLPFT